MGQVGVGFAGWLGTASAALLAALIASAAWGDEPVAADGAAVQQPKSRDAVAEVEPPVEVAGSADASATTDDANQADVAAAADGGAAEARRRGATNQRLRFNFASATWPAVLQWLADESGLNLNWTQMPESELNLMTQESYTVAEARNIINMHLLALGFTLLQRDETLFLVKLDESLNPTWVPRVQPDELDQRLNYEFVKVSFPLDWMLAETAAKEFAPILSPYGKIVPLTTTNRIEAMDAVVNLRELRELLLREQSDDVQEHLVVEFELEHANAVEVLEKLNDLLGLEKPLERMSRDQIRLARERMAIDAQMLKQLGDKAPPPKSNPEDVYLVVNERKNSILANAAPDKIAVIRQAVQSLDVPTGDRGLQLSEVTTMKVYPLNGAEADAVSGILEDLRDIGKLHPNARFSEDDDRQILFAYASLQDHLTIQSVMSQLANTSRDFRVVTLRRLKAVYVAESIAKLMTGESPYASQYERRRRDSDRRSNGATGGFRVEADTPNNRLFLFATDSEYRQVEDLLVKLGERPRWSATQRSIQVSEDSMDETLRQIRRIWPTISRNPLRVETDGDPATSATSGEREEDEGADDERGQKAVPRRPAPASNPALDDAASSPPSTATLLVQSDASHSLEEAGEQFRDEPDEASVEIRPGPDGELILSSDDPTALDRLEELVSELAPAKKQYTVFKLEHASPYLIQYTLSDVFGIDSLTSASSMRIVPDTTTKSIMVFGASDAELKEIEELIKFYDQAPAVDPTLERKPRAFRLQHVDAQVVAEVLKEVYRDLLSSNDRSLAQSNNGNNNNNRNQRQSQEIVVVNTASTQPRYRGYLSIGVFANTNTLMVSAPQYLMDEIAETIRQMDQDEAETVTEIVRLDGRVSPEFVAQQLQSVLDPASAAAARRPAETGPRNGQSESARRERMSPQRQGQERGENGSGDVDRGGSRRESSGERQTFRSTRSNRSTRGRTSSANR